METYIAGNKEAWEEAFECRDSSWGADLIDRIQKEEYAFFNPDTIQVLKKYDMRNKRIGQFCCNNGRELLSLVKTTGAKEGIGFDIAENQVQFATEKAKELNLPCRFVATNILEIDDTYNDLFDVVLITIGALCWFKDLDALFGIISRSMKKNGIILINEQHPFTNIIACPDEEEYDLEHPLNCVYSYFSHEWINNSGMYYITHKNYESKTFTDYTHSFSEIIHAMCKNHMVITDLQEFDYDISGGLDDLNGKSFPLSYLLEGRKDER